MSFTWTGAQVKAVFDAYLVCALWSSTDDEGEPLGLDLDDFSGEARTALRKDVVDFLQANEEDLAGIEPAQVGHDFWLSRNGHGAGFWDRGLGDLGDRLHAAAEVYGVVDLVVGDDGQVHVS